MTTSNAAVAKQFERWREADAAARIFWDKVDHEARKLVRIAKVGRRVKVVIPISESMGVEIKNQFKGEDKVFAPLRKWKIKEVAIVAESE